MLLLGVAALIGALLLARIAPRGPDAFARYPRERVDRRPLDPEAHPFPEHLRTPWRLYVHPDGSER